MSHHAVFMQQSDKMQAHLDSFIATGSDQELFIASYLHGHFDVAVAYVEKAIEQGESDPISTLKSKLEQQLQNAFSNNELSESDAKQVNELMVTLFHL